MLTIWNQLPTLFNRSDRMLSSKDFFDDFINLCFDAFIPGFGINSQEDENGNLSIHIDVPGMSDKDLTVELKDNVISIKGERKNKGNYYSLNKSFSINEKYNQETLKAEIKDGVLSLS